MSGVRFERDCPATGLGRASSPDWYDLAGRSRAKAGKRRLHFVREFVANERFFDNSGFADVLQCGFVCVSRYKQDWESWKFGVHLSSELQAVHARHGEIKQNKIEGGLPIQEIESGSAAANLKNDVAEFAQNARGDVSYCTVIIHEKNSCPFARVPSQHSRVPDHVCDAVFRCPGQVDLDRGSFSHAGINPYAPAGLLCETKNLAQS